MSPDAALMNMFRSAKRSSYVATRRGIPCRPSQCIGMKVRLKPMNRSQKLHLPRVSLYMRPVIFGNQW